MVPLQTGDWATRDLGEEEPPPLHGHGADWCGKTEFTVCHARLAKMLSQKTMKHEAVVVQFDEFQKVLSCWEPNSSGQGIAVAPGGTEVVDQEGGRW